MIQLLMIAAMVIGTVVLTDMMISKKEQPTARVVDVPDGFVPVSEEEIFGKQ